MGRRSVRFRLLRRRFDDLAHGRRRPQSVTAVTQQIKPQIYPRVDERRPLSSNIAKPKLSFKPHGTGRSIERHGSLWPERICDYGKKEDIRVRQRGSPKEKIAAKPVPPPYDNELTYFRAVILEGAKEDDLSSLETNVTVTEILDAARRSARKENSQFRRKDRLCPARADFWARRHENRRITRSRQTTCSRCTFSRTLECSRQTPEADR